MLTKILEIQDYAETLVAAANIQSGKKKFTVLFKRDVAPHTTIGKDNSVTIVLPMLNDTLTEEDSIRHKHHVVHEILHHTEGSSAWDVWKKEQIPMDHTDPLASMCNATEDYRIENLGSKHYLGDNIIISEGTNLDMDSMANILSDKVRMERVSKSAPDAAFVAVMVADIKERMQHNHFANERKFNESLANLPSVIKNNIKKLDGINYGKRLHQAKTVQDSVDLAKDAFKILFNKDPEEHAKEQQKKHGKGQEQSKDAGKGDGKKQEKGGKGEQGNEKQGDDGTDAGSDLKEWNNLKERNKKGKGKVAKAQDDNTKIVTKMVYYDQTKIKEHDGPALGSGANLNYSRKNPDDDGLIFVPTPKDELVIHDYVKNPPVEVRYRYKIAVATKERAKSLARPFANKVRRLIQARSDAHYIGNQTRGKLNRKAIYRIGVPQVGNGEWNSRVFKRRQADDILDTCIQLIVDSSGSMNNEKYFQAVMGATMLNEAFDKCLHVPVEILTFSELSRRTHIGIIKSFDTHISPDKLDLNCRMFAQSSMGNNSDGEALLYGYHRLIRMPYKRKIMVVLSDGSPVSSRGHAPSFTKKVIKEIESYKKIDLCAIGINHMGVKTLYKDYKIVHNIEQLPNAMLELLKNKIVH